MLIGEPRYFIYQGRIKYVPAIRGECSADFVGLAVASIVSPVIGNEPASSRVAGAVADGQVADAM